MGLEEVAGEILAEGKARAESLVSEAARERERLLGEARLRAHEVQDQRMRQAAEEVAKLRVRKLASAELEVKRARLAMERDLLEAVARGARDRVAAMAPPEDELHLLAVLRRVQGPSMRLYSAPRNEAFLRRAASLQYAGNIDCLGGLVLESPDGTVRMDHTYDTILRDALERLTRELYGMLFAR
jgi:V/A-type H+-transporting ATPase subunit E